jgi:hypothetical protein
MTVLLESIDIVGYEDRDHSQFFFNENRIDRHTVEKRRLPQSFSKEACSDFCKSNPLSEGFVLTDETETKSSDGSQSRSSDSSDLSIPDDELTNASFSSREPHDLLLNVKEVVIPSSTCSTSNAETCDDSARAKSVENQRSYMTLRITYLIVTLVVMLADGLQGRQNLYATNRPKYA